MTESVGDLRKIAEAATPGPWITDSLESGEHGVFVEEGNPDYRKLGCASAIVASHLVGKNAEYLEAFDPDTVLALLSRLEQAEQQVQAALRLADDWETGALRWEDPLRVPNEVFLLRKALQQPTHEPDWTDYQLGDPGASCSCGYNGPYKECWQSRRALDGDERG
ncbi:ead/Ea22-like family protein [Glutamicibacter protophormiae]|uniref:ead/Ea22-like family protein n=1 Tax=Glutamicibacter protophormiae TaxID=37930 RepID=UPI003A8E357E